MKAAALNFGLGSEFDDFLFAPIEERNGLPLSVVSLLGRMGLDPWQEAASLAALPADTAAQRLASLLRLRPAAAAQPDDGALAARLVALLPRRLETGAHPLQTQAFGQARHAPQLSQAIVIAIYLALLLATQFVLTHREPIMTEATRTPASPTLSSQTPPPIPAK